MKQRDDDLPDMKIDAQQPDNFRVRENIAIDHPEDDEEGMPSVNRKKKGKKATNALLLIVVLCFGFAVIYALNVGPSKKSEPKPVAKASTSALPPINFAPQAPARPASAQQGQNANAAPGAAPSQLNSNDNDVVKGPNGKPVLHWSDRKLIGNLVVAGGGQSSAQRASELPGGQVPDYPAGNQNSGELGGGRDSLAGRLQPTQMAGVSASTLSNRNFLITKGTPLDCALETAIDTTLPGIIVCRITRDVYSANGQVLLLDRGTKMVGEQQGNVKQGQARVFALWSRAETPNGVIINLDSPGTDSLGRAGLDGWVDNHFAERFGAAILMSVIQSSLEYMVAQQKENSGATILEDSSREGESVVGKILDNTINIPPTIIKNQGDHINVMVARDLDFSDVYDLEVNP